MQDKKIPVFYRPEMCADADSFSKSPTKPALVVDAWQSEGIPIEIKSFDPLTRSEIAVAHDDQMVDDVLDLKIPNGFGNKSAAVAASLPYTSGSMRAAVHAALENGIGAVSPTSGFHHAGYDFNGGFCTFNGLMIAAIPLLMDGWKVGILDLDMHCGNGTDDIASHFKLPRRKLPRHSQGSLEDFEVEPWLKTLPAFIVHQFGNCDVVLYQAGADPHVDDPLGGWLTTEQLFERDRIVFNTLRELRIPCAWNLAGGYQDPLSKVIEIHSNTMRAFSESFFKEV